MIVMYIPNGRDLRLQSSEIIKNYDLGGLNIEKRQLGVKGIFAQNLGFVWGPFQRGFGGFSG
jgi:hypothetical protein